MWTVVQMVGYLAVRSVSRMVENLVALSVALLVGY